MIRARRRSVVAGVALAACALAVCAGLRAMSSRPAVPPVPAYTLDVEPADYAALASSPFDAFDHAFRRWVPARFVTGGRAWDVEVTFENEAESPTWTVHFHGADPYLGVRDLALVLARDESDAGAVVAGERARSLGLLAASNGFATLRINGGDAGMVRWTEGRSNSMLMRLGYDKGEVFEVAPDALADGRVAASVRRVELARQPFAAPEAPPSRGAAAHKLRRLLELALEAGDAEFEREIGQYLNVEKYIAWNSLAWLFGSPGADVGPGAQWYFDPVTGLFEPTVTDLGQRAVPISYASFSDTHLSPIGTRLFRIPRYRDKRNRALWALLSDPDFDVAQATDRRFAALLPQLARSADAWPQVPRRRELERRQREANSVLAHNAARLRRILAPAAIEPDSGLALVGGRGGWAVESTRYSRASFAPAVAVGASGLDRWQMASNRNALGATYARAVARGATPVDPGSARDARAEARAVERAIRDSGLPFELRGDELVLPAGTHTLREDLILPASVRLTLEPGVTLLLDPGVSLLTFRGVTARGTAEQPIRIEQARRGEPYGAFGVVHAPEMSHLEHLVVRGGSAARMGGIELSGQLSFNASDFEMRHGEISGSVGGEGLSVKRGSFEVSHSSFVDNEFDGLDLEWARGSVRDSVFLENGDDGLDLGSSTARVSNCTFRGMFDKGISAGEGSRAWIADSKVEGSRIGIVSKEGSRVDLVRTEISGNGVGFSVYRDKPIFGAASGIIRGGRFSDNLRDLRIDPGSQIALRGVNDGFGAAFDEFLRFFTLRPALASAAQ